MTSFEIGLVAALIVMIGLLLVMLRSQQSGGSADLAELRGQLAQISSQSGALQNLIADQMVQSEGGLVHALNNHCETKMTAPQNR